MQAVIPRQAAHPQPGRSAGSAVHKFTKCGLCSALQELYILILLITPHATNDKREKCEQVKANFDTNGLNH